MNTKKIIALPIAALFAAKSAFAHCPLCTMGAATAAAGAAWLGVDKMVIGVFIGAFAVSIGAWIGNAAKKQYIPYQKAALIVLSFLLTVIPLLPVVSDDTPSTYSSVFISWGGEYGTLFNRTYLINLFLVGSIAGGAIVSATPWLSRRITALRDGNTLPFQGVALTLLLLLAVGAALQWVA